eukprot:GGOE01041300.1.p1 GENE.GGOE01041300.1~~GGOE01041300.1.p1  ORF type:complete len:643 (+),score=228.34 GGOE01041300.1:22-1929(+)
MSEHLNNCTVFVGRCPESVTDGDMYEHFAAVGADTIQGIRWAQKQGRFMGFGYIQFASPQLAAKAAALSPPMIGGRKLLVRHQAVLNDPKRKARMLLQVLKMKRKRMGGADASRMAQAGMTLPPRQWTPEELQHAPFLRDFSRLLRLQPRRPQEYAAFYKEHCLQVEGLEVRPVLDFSEVHFGKPVMDLLSKFPKPMPIQSVAWPILLQGHDCVGLAKTGSGKTLAYSLPGIMHVQAQKKVEAGEGPIILVIAPTRELVLQIALELEKFRDAAGINVGMAYGGQDGGADRLRQARKVMRGCDVVVAAPGRLTDFVEAGVSPLDRVTYFVLDEADQLLAMGFEPQVSGIVGQLRPDRQTMMFSATWDLGVQNLATQYLTNPIKVTLDNSDLVRANSDVAQHLLFSESPDEKKDLLVLTLKEFRAEHPKSSRTIIFVKSREAAEALETFLAESFPKCVWTIHGDVTQGCREKALEAFRRCPTSILVATDVASRGLDIQELACVINYHLPREIARYVHRIGRTGRAGHKGLAISFFDEADWRLAPELQRCMEEAGQEVPPDLEQYVRMAHGSGNWGWGGEWEDKHSEWDHGDGTVKPPRKKKRANALQGSSDPEETATLVTPEKRKKRSKKRASAAPA